MSDYSKKLLEMERYLDKSHGDSDLHRRLLQKAVMLTLNHVVELQSLSHKEAESAVKLFATISKLVDQVMELEAKVSHSEAHLRTLSNMMAMYLTSEMGKKNFEYLIEVAARRTANNEDILKVMTVDPEGEADKIIKRMKEQPK